MANAVKSKIVPGKDLGEPSAVKLLQGDNAELMMGTVFGIVSGIIQRKMPTGEVYEGLKGTFQAVPADPKRDTITSGVCYLPSGFYELIADPFKALQAEDETATLKFGFEVSAVKANNPAGYSWKYQPLVEPSKDDPLATFRAELSQAGAKLAVTDQSGEGAAEATTTAKPAASKSKRR